MSIGALLPALLYLTVWWLSRRAGASERSVMATDPLADLDAPGGTDERRGAVAWLIPAGLFAHSLALYLSVQDPEGLRFGFAQALSATFGVGVLILYVEGFSARVRALHTVVMPIAAVASLLPFFFPGTVFPAARTQPLFLPHLFIGTMAYGVLMLAAVHAAMMAEVERSLHGGARKLKVGGGSGRFSPFAHWLEDLPPLLVLERILFRFITIGFVLLTLTALSGVLFTEEVFGRPLRLDHKTVFTLVAWVMFGTLLVGRSRWGWRGRTALRLTIGGFTVLLLAYVGSRFVLEVILQRAA